MENKQLMQRTHVSVDVDQSIKRETESKIFARLCQLLSQNDSKIMISFDDYDRIAQGTDIEQEVPNFFDKALIQNIAAMRIIEIYLKEKGVREDITSVDDLLGAVINPTLCINKQIKSYSHENYVIFELIETE